MDRAEARPFFGPLTGLTSADDGKRAPAYWQTAKQLGGTGLVGATVKQSGKPHTSFVTPEEASQAYLQHWQTDHPKELEKERQQGPRAPCTVLLPVQEHLLMRSDSNLTGFKGVCPNEGRYKATCSTAPCHDQHLGMFATPEEAAQAFLQHWQTNHPEELKKVQQQGPRAPRPVLLPVQEHLLMRSDKGSTGFKGVCPKKGRYKAKCNRTAPCHDHHLGSFGTPEEAGRQLRRTCSTGRRIT
jgi:hypothetical protein